MYWKWSKYDFSQNLSTCTHCYRNFPRYRGYVKKLGLLTLATLSKPYSSVPWTERRMNVHTEYYTELVQGCFQASRLPSNATVADRQWQMAVTTMTNGTLLILVLASRRRHALQSTGTRLSNVPETPPRRQVLVPHAWETGSLSARLLNHYQAIIYGYRQGRLQSGIVRQNAFPLRSRRDREVNK